MKKKNVVIAGGGTGGHIYPGIALAQELKRRNPDIQVHFVGAKGGLEEKIVPSNGYPLHQLNVGRLHHSVGVLQRIKTLILLPLSLFHSVFLYLKLRPLWVIGIGGFASGPFVLVSALLGGKTAILEPNAFPGMANRMLSKFVKTCFVVFEKTKSFFPSHKVKKVGLPVRLAKKKPSMDYSSEKRPFRILVFGGSQGARGINNVFGPWVQSLGTQSKNYEIYHQTGHRDFSLWEKEYGDRFDGFLRYSAYIDNMPEMLDWADLIICRSGIGSVVEVAMAGKPAIFVPLPTAADNHQVHNAQVLAEEHAAMMIEQKELSVEKLDQVIENLRQNPVDLKAMMARLQEFDYSSAPKEILNQLMKD